MNLNVGRKNTRSGGRIKSLGERKYIKGRINKTLGRKIKPQEEEYKHSEEVFKPKK